MVNIVLVSPEDIVPIQEWSGELKKRKSNAGDMKERMDEVARSKSRNRSKNRKRSKSRRRSDRNSGKSGSSGDVYGSCCDVM